MASHLDVIRLTRKQNIMPRWLLGINYARMCVLNSEGYGFLFSFKLVNEMNERMSFKMGIIFVISLRMGRTFEIYCMKFEAKVLRLNYKQCEEKE